MGAFSFLGHLLFTTASLVFLFSAVMIPWRFATPAGRALPPARGWRAVDLAVRAFCTSDGLLVLLGVWAALEATVWFIIPEFPLLLTIFLRRGASKWAVVVADLVGSLVGATAQYIAGAVAGSAWVDTIPYVTAPMVTQADVWLRCLGPMGLVFQPYSGVPFKVFGATASDAGVGYFAFVGLGLVVRLQRYILVVLALAGLAAWKGPFVARWFWAWMPVALIIYTALLLQAVGAYPPDYDDFQGYQALLDRMPAAWGFEDRC